MAVSRVKVFQEWQRHVEAPVALMRMSSGSSDVLAVDEDATLHLVDRSNTVLLSKPLPWMPAAIALDAEGTRLAALSAGGTLLVLDRNGDTFFESRVAWRPGSADMSADGQAVAFTDGSGRVGVVELTRRTPEFCEAKGPYAFVRFLAYGSDLVAVGVYGQVLFLSNSDETYWQKDYRCHTRMPAVSAGGEIILIPSPHYGVIALRRDGREIGLFDVPESPKGVAVSANGQKIFVVNEKNELLIFEQDGKNLLPPASRRRRGLLRLRRGGRLALGDDDLRRRRTIRRGRVRLA